MNHWLNVLYGLSLVFLAWNVFSDLKYFDYRVFECWQERRPTILTCGMSAALIALSAWFSFGNQTWFAVAAYVIAVVIWVIKFTWYDIIAWGD